MISRDLSLAILEDIVDEIKSKLNTKIIIEYETYAHFDRCALLIGGSRFTIDVNANDDYCNILGIVELFINHRSSIIINVVNPNYKQEIIKHIKTGLGVLDMSEFDINYA